MPDYLDKILNDSISDSTKKMYRYHLVKLNGGKPVTNLKFLEDHEHIIDQLKDLSARNKKNYLASVSSIISKYNKPSSKLREAHKIYKKEMLDIVTTDQGNGNILSTKNKDNWVTNDEVKKKFNLLTREINKFKNNETININQYNTLLEYVILSLYTLTQPRREKDYTECVINDNDEDEKNVLNIKDNHFIFRQYKTVKVNGVQKVPIPKKLLTIINIYLKFHKLKGNDYPYQFLIWNNGEPFKRLDIYKVLSKLFNKKTGSTNMRRLYITSKYGNLKDELKKDAELMGTSESIIESNYIKDNI